MKIHNHIRTGKGNAENHKPLFRVGSLVLTPHDGKEGMICSFHKTKDNTFRYKVQHSFKSSKYYLEDELEMHPGGGCSHSKPRTHHGYSIHKYNNATVDQVAKRYQSSIIGYELSILLSADKQTWFAMGNSYLELKKYKKAIHCYNKALRMSPKYDSAFNNKGIALYRLGRYEEAMWCFLRVIAIYENVPFNMRYNPLR